MSLAANIRTRRSFLNWSQKELAQRAGVSQQLINALEAERVRSSKYTRDIAAALGCKLSDLDPSYGGLSEDPSPTLDTFSRLGDLAIHGARETKNGAIIVTAEPIDYISRPEPLANVRGGYGVIIANNTMAPEFEIGDIALVNPHLPAVPGTACIFYTDSKGHELAMVHRLQGITSEHWTVKTWQPGMTSKSEAELPRKIWQKCHRIVGRYYRR
jgi:transcriptional regulator with XRE-family HTH domain